MIANPSTVNSDPRFSWILCPVAAFQVSINIRLFCKERKMQEEKSVGRTEITLASSLPPSAFTDPFLMAATAPVGRSWRSLKCVKLTHAVHRSPWRDYFSKLWSFHSKLREFWHLMALHVNQNIERTEVESCYLEALNFGSFNILTCNQSLEFS